MSGKITPRDRPDLDPIRLERAKQAIELINQRGDLALKNLKSFKHLLSAPSEDAGEDE